MQKSEQKVSVELGASFTCDMMKPYIEWWLSKYNLKSDIEILPFDQVIQFLIGRKTKEYSDAEYLVLLQRLEDFGHNITTLSQVRNELNISINQYKELIGNYNGRAKLLIGLFGVSDTVARYGDDIYRFLEEANEEFGTFLFSLDNIDVLDFRNMREGYAIYQEYDELAYKLGALPYTDEYLISASTVIARKLIAQTVAPHKVIVLDCDNTLWCGECADNTAEITSDYLLFQNYLIQKKNEGFLLAICSKNNLADVEAFMSNDGMLLSMSDFVAYRVNWNPKSENIKSLASELNLGLDSFVFIDDSVHECLEVMNAIPEVLTIRFPQNSEAVSDFIKHIWALDKVHVTKEDFVRTRLYLEERERKELSDSALSMDEYVEKLEMKIYVSPIEADDYDRATQLINRTNQFNLNLVRRSKEQLLEFLNEQHNEGYIVNCRDRYGDYGISGVLLLSETEEKIIVDTFLLSCRVLGRRVENAVLFFLLRLCASRGGKRLSAEFVDSGRNMPIKKFMDNEFFEYNECTENADHIQYQNTEFALDAVEKSLLNIQVFNDRLEKEAVPENKAITFEHIGIAVKNMAEAVRMYREAGFHIGNTVQDKYQKASLCMCSREDFPNVELIEPADDNIFIRELISEKTYVPYHICLATKDLDEFITGLLAAGFEYIEVSSPKPAILFNYDRVMFIYIDNVGIIEIRERKDSVQICDLKRVQISYNLTDYQASVSFFSYLGLSIQDKSKSNVIMTKFGYPLLGFHETDEVKERYNISEILYDNAQDMGQSFFAEGSKNRRKASRKVAHSVCEWDVLYDSSNINHANSFRFALANHTAAKLLREYNQLTEDTEVLDDDIRAGIYKLMGMILKHEHLDLKKNFASNGGNSLQALSLLSKINSRYHIAASLEDVLLSENIEVFVDKQLAGGTNYEIAKYEHVPENKKVAATMSQQRMFLFQLLNPDSTAYNMSRCMYICGEYSIDKIQTAFSRLIENHQGLRLNFGIEDGVVHQYIRDYSDFKVQKLTAQHTEEEIIKDFIRPFNLAEDMLLRVSVAHTENGKTLLLFDIHHILVDGTSLSKILENFLLAYDGREIQPSAYGMLDYAAYYNRAYRIDTAFWQEVYKKSVPDTTFPIDSTIYFKNTYKGEKKLFSVDAGVLNKIYKLADEAGVSVNAVLLAAYCLLLSKYTGEDRIVVSVPLSGRDSVESEDIIGLIIDTVPICAEIDYENDIEEYIRYISNILIEAYEHRHFPYETFSEGTYRMAYIMQNMEKINFVSSNIVWNDIKTEDFSLLPVEFDEGNSKYDISFELSEHAGGLCISIEYCTDLFEKSTIERLYDNYISICFALCVSRAEKLKNLVINDDSSNCILSGERKYYEFHTVIEGFEKVAKLYPDYVAVSDEKEDFTYSELCARAQKLARYLISKGVTGGDIIAILADRRAYDAVMIFAVLMAGATYLPLSKEYPDNRIEKILASSGARYVISDEIRPCLSVPTVLLSDVKDSDDYADVSLPTVSEDDLAYVIYTSGTTGEPKGVQICHKGILNYAMWRIQSYRLDCSDAALELLPMSFDGFCSNFYSTLLSAGELVVVDDDHWRDFEYIGRIIKKKHVTNISLLPTMYRGILENSSEELVESLRLIILAGEKTGRDLIRLSDRMNSNITLVNEYGATENTVTTTANISMDETNNESVGKPVFNNHVCVLDRFGNILPKGMCGELAVWGESLSSGYVNDTTLTAAKFSACRQIPGNKAVYRTGDRVLINSHDEVRFIGRMDNQVKLRGYRIELSEIEQVAQGLAGIEGAIAAVITREDNQYICLFIRGRRIPDSQELLGHLTEYLPAYMIPTYYAITEEIPMTSNGKVDVNRLKDIELMRLNRQTCSMPGNDIEQRLFNICTSILKSPEIGMDISFTSAGGQSLDVARLKRDIYEEFKVDLEMSALFRAVSLRETAALISEKIGQQVDVIKPYAHGNRVAMSSAQKRIFLLEQIEDVGKSYHIPVFFRLSGKLDEARLEKALNEMVAVHEILRTTFNFVDGKPIQIINDAYEVSVKKENVASHDIDYVRWSADFDLTRLPLFRVVLFADNVLLFEFHHIITDGASIKMFMEELSGRYNGENVPAPKQQYSDYVLHEEECKKDRERNAEYWHSVFETLPGAMEYPTDYARKEVTRHEGKCITVNAADGLQKRISESAARLKTTEFTIMLAAYNVMLAQISNTDDVVVGIPTLGRNHPQYANIQGIFINVLAIRNEIDFTNTVKEYISSLSAKLIDAYEHEDYPFEELVDGLAIPKVTNRKPLFDVMFVMRDFEALQLKLGDCNCAVIDYMPDVAKYDFTLTVSNDESLRFNLQYNCELFEENTVCEMLNKYINVLEQMLNRQEAQMNCISVISDVELECIRNYEMGNIIPAEYDTVIRAIYANGNANPLRKAIVHGNKFVTYKDFLSATDEYRSKLAAIGIQRGDVVAIAMDPCIELITIAVAIQCLGAAYLPMDIATPVEQIRFCLKDSAAKYLIVIDKETISGEGLPIVALDEIRLKQGIDISERYPDIEDTAYIIYTSGTTGVPKGVMVSHGNLANYTNWFCRENKLENGINSALLSGFNFDLGYSVVYPTLSMAGTLHLLSKNDYLEKETTLKYIADNQIDYLKMTPTLFSFLFSNCTESLGKLRLLVLGGESLNENEVINFMVHNPNIEIMNHYGPTETTIGTVFNKLASCRSFIHKMHPVIGKPVDNSVVYILSKDNRRVPFETEGEICVAGKGVSKGYLNAGDNGKFVTNPYSTKYNRLYKTGDFGYRLRTGEIVFTGRRDKQLKIHGYRVDINEIRNNLLEYKGIDTVEILVDEHNSPDNRLLAFYIASNTIAESSIRSFLRQRIAEYMIPSRIVRVDLFPMNKNGKLDVAALINSIDAREFSPDEEITETCMQIKNLWIKLLGRNDILADDNFFDVGGNSILLIKLQGLLKEELGLNLRVVDLFQHPTVKRQASLIEDNGKGVSYSGLEVSAEWFDTEVNDSSLDCYYISFSDTVCSRLTQVATGISASVESVFASVFVYIWNQTTGSDRMLLVWKDDTRHYRLFDCDMNAIEDFEELIACASNAMKNTTAYKNLDSKRADNRLSFVCGTAEDGMSFGTDIDMYAGISCDSNNEIKVTVRFDTYRINAGKVKEFLGQTNDVLMYILEQFTER